MADSEASVNRAFIGSMNTKERESSKNNTSFFGKELQEEERLQDKLNSFATLFKNFESQKDPSAL